MDEDMILLDYNIMPVEVAIRRELEYRKKMEALRMYLQIDFVNDLSRKHPQNACVNDIWEKQPRNDSVHYLLPLKEESLSNPTGLKRKEPSSTSCQGVIRMPYPSSEYVEFQKQPAGLLCMTCEEAFSTLHYLKGHCASQAHKEKLNKLRNSGKNMGNFLWCKLCNAPGSSALTLEQHLRGIKHAAALKTLELRASGEKRAECSSS